MIFIFLLVFLWATTDRWITNVKNEVLFLEETPLGDLGTYINPKLPNRAIFCLVVAINKMAIIGTIIALVLAIF